MNTHEKQGCVEMILDEIKISKVENLHVVDISINARQADRREWFLQSSADPHPLTSLIHNSVKYSALSFAIEHDESTIAIFGLVHSEIQPFRGKVWAIFSNKIEERRYHITLVRKTQSVIEKLLESYSILENYVHAKNLRGIRFLRSAGFTVTNQVKKYMEEDFFYFYISKNNIVLAP